MTGQEHPKTSVTYGYPSDEGDPYYPVPRPENTEMYRRYKALADQTPGVHFVGRLATYKDYNMDQVVAQALTTYVKITGAETARGKRRPAAVGSLVRERCSAIRSAKRWPRRRSGRASRHAEKATRRSPP